MIFSWDFKRKFQNPVRTYSDLVVTKGEWDVIGELVWFKLWAPLDKEVALLPFYSCEHINDVLKIRDHS